MPNPTYKTGDTWPKLTGTLSDTEGPVDISAADSLRIVMKVGSTVIQGVATNLDTGPSNRGRWEYQPAAADFTVVGEYEVEIEVTWNSSTTPPEIETYPNDKANNPVVHVTADLD